LVKSSVYRSPKDITQGPVLIVGGGNSGFQIAEEINRFRASAPGTRQVKADSARLKAA